MGVQYPAIRRFKETADIVHNSRAVIFLVPDEVAPAARLNACCGGFLIACRISENRPFRRTPSASILTRLFQRACVFEPMEPAPNPDAIAFPKGVRAARKNEAPTPFQDSCNSVAGRFYFRFGVCRDMSGDGPAGETRSKSYFILGCRSKGFPNANPEAGSAAASAISPPFPVPNLIFKHCRRACPPNEKSRRWETACRAAYPLRNPQAEVVFYRYAA